MPAVLITTEYRTPPRELPAGHPCWHVVGLDLGQAADYSALAVLEATDRATGPPDYAVRHLHRWQLGTRYTTIVEDVRELVARPPLSGPLLVVDGTGVGAAVVDLFAAAALAALPLPVLITAGHAALLDEAGRYHIPKKELVSVLQVLLQSRRLEVSPALPEARTLAKELAVFKVKVTAAGNETFEAWRERDHDDLVLAVALAAWAAEAVARGAAASEGETTVCYSV